MKKVFFFTFILLLFINGCSMSETYQMKKYIEIPTKYDNTCWCMSREEVKEVIDIDEILLVEDEESITTYESRINSEFAVFCLDLMNPPKITYKFYNDMLYEIELKVEDNKITPDLYNEFSEWLNEKYELFYESPVEDIGFGLKNGGRAWKIDEHENEMTLVLTISGNPIIHTSNMVLTYSNFNVSRLIPNEIKYD